jgi:hypothetical protein
MKTKLAIFAVLLASMVALAQEKPAESTSPPPKMERPLSFYKVEYVLRELQDGKAINSRNFVMTIEDNDRGEAKVGARVPVNVGGTVPNSQWQYMDVGVNINCRISGKGDYAALRTMIEISSFALAEQQGSGPAAQPVVRQMRTDMAAVVPLGKPTVIGIIDDVNSTKRYEVAVTATKLK